MRALFIVIRIAGVIAGVAAMVGQLITTYNNWTSLGIENRSTAFVNFFSFFTIDSNVGAVVVFAIGAVLLIRKIDDPRWFAILRASITSYMVVTFIVYNLLLRGIELPQGSTVPWSNEVLHVVACVWLVLDWFYAPGRSPIPAQNLWKVLVFPIVWVGYTLVRGPLVADTVYGNPFWYPYPFLNPETSAEGYFTVAFYVLLIAVAIGSTAAGVLWISRRMRAT